MDNDAFIKRIALLAQKWNETERWVKEGEKTAKKELEKERKEKKYSFYLSAVSWILTIVIAAIYINSR